MVFHCVPWLLATTMVPKITPLYDPSCFARKGRERMVATRELDISVPWQHRVHVPWRRETLWGMSGRGRGKTVQHSGVLRAETHIHRDCKSELRACPKASRPHEASSDMALHMWTESSWACRWQWRVHSRNSSHRESPLLMESKRSSKAFGKILNLKVKRENYYFCDVTEIGMRVDLHHSLWMEFLENGWNLGSLIWRGGWGRPRYYDFGSKFIIWDSILKIGDSGYALDFRIWAWEFWI